MFRITVITAVLGCAVVPAPAPAGPLTPAAAQCVNREKTAWRPVRDPILDATSLRFCTGADCWSLDLASGAVTAAPSRAPAPPAPAASLGVLTDAKGQSLATVDEHHAELCTGKAACQTFKLAFANPAINGMFAHMNAARTLAAVLYMPDTDRGLDPEVVAFDLVARKQVGRLTAEAVDVLDHGFVIDHVKLYSAAWQPIGQLAAADRNWLALGSTDVVALRDTDHGAVVIQDTTTGKVRARIPTGAPDPAAIYLLVASPDARKLYAIGGGIVEGEVLTIDVAAAKVIARTTAAVCAAGTHRLN